MEYPKEYVKLLIEGKLDSEELWKVQTSPKDDGRFEKVLEIEQERVPWKEEIIVPLQEKLYIVKKGKDKVVKCECGYEFGDYRKNWKESALVYQRETEEQLEEIHVYPNNSNPNATILREFYCPGCTVQLDVEAVPQGYPFIFKALPDID